MRAARAGVGGTGCRMTQRPISVRRSVAKPLVSGSAAPVARPVTGGEAVRSDVGHRLLALMLVMAVSLLFAGCEPRATQATSTASAPNPVPTYRSTATAAPTPTALIVSRSAGLLRPTQVRVEPVQASATKRGEVEDGAKVENQGLIQNDVVTITIIYDNNTYNPELRTAWGFACLVETRVATVLFDTGADSPTLLGNMDELGIAPQAIDAIVLSHIHGDHIGGLLGLLDTGIHPRVYVPAAFPRSFKESVYTRTELVEVTDPAEVLPGIHTTGEVGTGIIEQALVVETKEGLIVVTGCAHPGILEMVRRAKETLKGDVALVIGGFHLGGADRGQIEQIIDGFRLLGVRGCAPCHCTGDQARRMFLDAFGANCFLVGVGQVIIVGADEVQVIE